MAEAPIPGRNTLVSLRMTADELREVDATAASLGVTRSDLIRARLRWAVASERVDGIKTGFPPGYDGVSGQFPHAVK